MKIAIDTDVLIYLVKKGILERFLEKYEACLTVINEYEYVRGEVKAGIASDKSKSTITSAFRILDLDNESIKIASEIWSELSRRGELIDERDLLIGAICISNKIPLWTFNKRHFKRLEEFGLVLIDVDLE